MMKAMTVTITMTVTMTIRMLMMMAVMWQQVIRAPGFIGRIIITIRSRMIIRTNMMKFSLMRQMLFRIIMMKVTLKPTRNL